MSKRLLELDALRGIAVLGVMFFHYTTLYMSAYDPTPTLFDFCFGQHGIHLFFIISGFVIYMTLEKSSPMDFIVSRFSRLYPAYWAGILLTSLAINAFTLG